MTVPLGRLIAADRHPAPTIYTESFYEVIGDGARRSAEEVVPAVLELTHARSVVDIGCGTGAWLRCFQQNGVTEVLGIDGQWARPEILGESEFIAVDLSKPFHLNRRFDLVVSLEVAEHLPASSAADFVASLVRLAPMVLFSAAIPEQGGVNHINEQWPEYWATLFATHGYRVVDCVRSKVWNNDRVQWWYAQNTMLYVDAGELSSLPALDAIARDTELQRLSIIHPQNYLNKIKDMDRVYYRPDPDRFCLSTLISVAPRVLLNAIRRRFRLRF